MVYFLDQTLYQTFSDREMTENEIYFFTDMASAYRSGKCYICGDNQTLKFFSEKIPAPFNGIYKALLNRYYECRALIEKVQKVFVITMNLDSCADLLPDMLRKSDKSYIIFLQYAMNWKIQHECCLLAENLDDCRFYELIVEHYKVSHGLQGIDTKFHYENGGGTTTADVLKKCISQDKIFTLCIIDSDQKYGKTSQYPQEPKKGDTCYKVMDASKNLTLSDNPPHDFILLEVHEVENLIPLCIFIELQNKFSDAKDGVDMLISLKNIDNGQPILYYDMKKGFSLDINEKPKLTYWNEILKSLKETEFHVPHLLPPICCKKLLSKANSLIVQKISDGSLQIDKYLAPHWKNIAEIMLTWGCATEPMYV